VLKSFRYLFLPIAFLYGGILKFRNWLYDKGILKSASFNFPIICVGNLAVGGTGKTPMVEYLAQMLLPAYKVATLSRGYKRKTRGFAIANEKTTAIEIGDEPMQFHQKFPELIVSVGEERLVAIPQLLHQRPETELIILDDAFQHRPVQAGLNILLTEYKNLYTRDFLLPVGDLRDVKTSSKRADIIVVTKCKSDLGEEERKAIIKELKPTASQAIYFSEIVYSQPYHLFSKEVGNLNSDTEVLLICGIANPKPLKEFLNKHVGSFDEMRFADHHIFNSTDLRDIKRHFEKNASPQQVILTTEKDGVRLQKFAAELSGYPIYVLPIRHRILFDQQTAFETSVISFINGFEKRNVN
jgi:tetraacyldisaccharide 4'-kinase